MNDIYDVAVIGGGPAGMMAAGRAAELGANVILLEKNPTLGKKLLITGGGRCNILNAEFDTRRLTEKYGKKGKSLFSVFSQFDVQATIDFFAERGLKIKVEAEKRAFPVSNSAADVHRTMIECMKSGGVHVAVHSPVNGFITEAGMITAVKIPQREIYAKNFILATGGKSHPETGSTGEGLTWLTDLGHTVIEPDAALVPITIKDPWVGSLAGISLKGVKLTVLQNGKKKAAAIGKMLFTHTGLSGPLVLNMSKTIGDLLQDGEVMISLDLFPSLDGGALDRKIREIFAIGKSKMIKNHIGELVSPRLGHLLLKKIGIDPETKLARLPREERIAFGKALKDIQMTVSGLLSEDDAIVTSGGVSLKEIEFSSMRSKLIPNLFFAGDIMDFDRPSGGFSLQICWTTGRVAGEHAAENKEIHVKAFSKNKNS